MRTLPFLLALALPFAASAAHPDPLAGMKPSGVPVDCIDLFRLDRSAIVGGTAIVWSDGGNRAYVNTPPGGCPGLAPDRAITYTVPGTRLCRGDIVTVFDPVAHIPFGSCGLGAFTPYAR